MASILPVNGEGPYRGVLAALKLSRRDDPLSVEALRKEQRVFEALCRAPGEPPCPRLYDVVEEPAPGLVMEWCPTDLERWWADRHGEPHSFPELCEALAAVCRRVREYAIVSEMELGERVVHADIKPRNILRSTEGRWLLTDFGAAKSRSLDEENWVATRMIIGTENYIAPETLFNARKPYPAAMDTWSIGCTFFACLRMCSLLRGGGKLPSNGTHAHHFRTHRAALVADLQLRRPTLFADRELDASVFPSPERLPDKDRAAIADALRDTLGNTLLEERLVADATNLLDRALQIDPARRYVDPIEMAGDLEALAQRGRELAARAEGGPTGPRSSAPAVRAPAPSPPHPSAAQAPAGGGAWRWVVGGGAVLIAAGLVLLVGLAGLGWWWRTRGTPSSTVAGGVPAESGSPVAGGAGTGATGGSGAGPGATPGPATRGPAAPGGEPAGSGASAGVPEGTGVASGGGAQRPPRAAEKLGDHAPAGEGTVLVLGAEAYLKGKGGRRAPGTVPAGTYELYAQIGSASFVDQGTVTVEPGDRIVWRCGFGKCKETEASGAEDGAEEEEEEGGDVAE